MNTETINALADRVEGAVDNRVLRDVFIALHKGEVISDGPYDAAMRFMNAGAYLDAALTLVPEGWSVSHAWWNPAAAGFTLKRKQGEWPTATAATPALALCAAALRAMAGREGV